MTNQATSEAVTHFLKNFKQTLQNGKFTLISRNDNLKSISYLGLSIRNVREIILDLTFCNYCGGPLQDQKYRGNFLWEFGVKSNGYEIYIKLSDDFRYDYAKCVSFHIAKREMKYPYQDRG